MFSVSFLLGFAGAIVSVLGSPGSPPLSSRVLHEYRRDVLTGWTLHKRADPDATLPLSIALAQSNLHNLESYLLDIADPESLNYGKHWSPAKVAETFRPSAETVDVVHSWLATDGVDRARIQLSSDGSYVRVNVSVAEAERLLATQYYVYQNEDGATRYGCQHGYHLPEHVSPHVDLVTPTIHFGTLTASFGSPSRRSDHTPGKSSSRLQRVSQTVTPLTTASTADTGYGCDEEITLDCIRQLYGFNYDVVAADKNTIGILELGTQNYNADNLDAFFKTYAPDQVGSRPKLISIDGGSENPNQSDSGLISESDLDFMLVMGLLGKKQTVYQYQVGDGIGGIFEPLFAAFDQQYCKDAGYSGDSSCGGTMKTNVISVSYAGGESGPTSSTLRTCNEMGKLALSGITFVLASGDWGVAALPGQSCLKPDGTVDQIVNGATTFYPDFPATCPYVTVVGATEVKQGGSVSDPEVATTGFPSGGGFSNVFVRPSYQDRVVSTYLSKYAPSYGASIYNRTGRGYPDVAANGNNIVVTYNGKPGTTGGTSASAPMFAAMIAAVNDARIAAGKSPVGWINPALYSSTFANIFNDVTEGDNPGCGTRGFPAAPGWDPVTGLGTVNFPRMLSRFMALP
ncbi:hypothetical protein ONZ51_g8987 [Trametes cubensis]|uniref:tripeptidyl-peptidase II n=1 Tax=Trametes cubensis TaxID=1111947 RepID=A0AAD7XAB2_9APHY|nr:hypothetical protein ONZ51_g8987 [Trametes cubensis]